jgi:hypothetical protein
MDGRIRLAGFILIFTASIVLSFYVDDYLSRTQDADKNWLGAVIVFLPLIIVIMTSGFLAKSVKQLLLYSFFAGLILVIFLYAQDYFSPYEGDGDLIKTSDGWIWISAAFCFFTFIISFAAAIVAGLGMFLSYVCAIIFKSEKTEAPESR